MVRLSLFRRFARSIACLLLLTGSTGFQHSGKDDVACIAGDTPAGDASGLGTAPDDSADHCLVCHWTRSLRSPSASVASVHAAFIAEVRVDVRQPAAERGPALARGPARAPPHAC